MISVTLDAENNANNIDTLSAVNLSDNKSFPGSSHRRSNTISASQINGYFGWGGALSNMSDMRADTRGWLSTLMFPIVLCNKDITYLWVPMVLHSNPF